MRTFRKTRWVVVGLVLITSVAFSQEGEKPAWAPEQATGAPDTFEAGDRPTAWATLREDAGEEWLKLEYARAVDVQKVRILETYNPGAVRKVTAFGEDGEEFVIWEGVEPVEEAPAVFEVVAKEVVSTKSLKIHMDTKRVRGWNEIDAVQLVGADGSAQWATKASASSTYASQSASAVPTVESLPPSVVKTVPRAGDVEVDASLDEIQVTFSKEMLTDRMWAFVQISSELFPKRPEGKGIRYLDDKRTCVMPVELEPGRTYVVWINSGRFNSFRDVQNNPAVPYLLVFKTKAD